MSAMPGDELIPEPGMTLNRTAMFSAPAAEVFPWIVQLGKRRAGWYFPRWVELAVPRSRRALRRLDPTFQGLAVGDYVPDWGPGDAQFRVEQLTPPHTLVYLSLRERGNGWRWPIDETPREGLTAFSWALTCTDIDGGCRFDARLRSRTQSQVARVFGDAFDWATVTLMAAGLRERLG